MSIQTIERYLEKDFDLTEILNGVEIMSPSPFSKHQSISRKIFKKIDRYIEEKKLGETYYSPLDVIFEENVNRLQPDIIFIKHDNMAIVQDWIRGIPDMVCEIVSIGTHKRDTITKKEIYERYQVPEYWIIVPELQTIEVLTIGANKKYQVFSYAEGEGFIQSMVIEGLIVDIKDVFNEDK
ncbi:MAG: Uma2 family endonuclease [Candidatus Magnetoovum sp. WYHC-5]|nr:Uma2 family endonuclease [Candidatus Magnetoovum sp. WYHC-5]